MALKMVDGEGNGEDQPEYGELEVHFTNGGFKMFSDVGCPGFSDDHPGLFTSITPDGVPICVILHNCEWFTWQPNKGQTEP